jgi:predicted ABC-type ATPase
MPGPRPYLWVFAGPNGAGKSTLVAKYVKERLPIVNPDAIALAIDTPRPGSTLQMVAGKIALRERNKLLSERQSFVVETTLSGNTEIRLMREAGPAGYKVNLVYVHVRLAVSQGRVAHRVAMGLHSVSPEDIWRRYPRSLSNLPEAMRLADRTFLVDNSSKAFRLLLVRENNKTRILVPELPSWVGAIIPEHLL